MKPSEQLVARRDAGMTIIEVLIALVILVVGIMGLAQLQTSSLSFSSRAEELRTATQVAEGEVEWRRQTELDIGGNQACASHVPDGYSCRVTVVPCKSAGVELTCEAGLASPVAYEIIVGVDGPRTEPFVLRTMTTGAYVAGGSGDTGTDPVDAPVDEPDDAGDSEEGGDSSEDGSDEGELVCAVYAGNSHNCKEWTYVGGEGENPTPGDEEEEDDDAPLRCLDERGNSGKCKEWG